MAFGSQTQYQGKRYTRILRWPEGSGNGTTLINMAERTPSMPFPRGRRGRIQREGEERHLQVDCQHRVNQSNVDPRALATGKKIER